MGHKQATAETYQALAEISERRDDQQQTEHLLLKAIDIEKNSQDKKLLAPVLGKLATVYLRRGHPRRAKSILKKAKLIYDQLDIASGQADVLGHLGIV